MQLPHALARTHALFDGPNLMSHAGLVPVMALAQRAVGRQLFGQPAQQALAEEPAGADVQAG